MQPALTAAVRLGLVTIVPVPRIPSEARYGATAVSSRAMLVLWATQLSAAVSSVRENNSVTNGPGGPATAGIAVVATTGSANIRAATAAASCCPAWRNRSRATTSEPRNPTCNTGGPKNHVTAPVTAPATAAIIATTSPWVGVKLVLTRAHTTKP